MKTVVITGGGGGIGQAVGLHFFRYDYFVVLADVVAPETLSGKPLKEYEQRVIGLACDVSIGAQVTELFEEIKRVISPRDITSCVNCAGVEGDKLRLHEVPEELFDKVISVNLKGVFLCMKEAIRCGAKSIVNISSLSGQSAMVEFSPYACSKAGVISLTKTAAKEYASSGIRINCVCPGTIETPMVQRFTEKWPEWQKATNAAYPIGRIGLPEEVAEAVFFLTEGPGFIIGECLALGGGINL